MAQEIPMVGDMLTGAASIAEFLGISRRQVFHWAESGRIPTFKLGKLLCARRSTLTSWMAELEAANSTAKAA